MRPFRSLAIGAIAFGGALIGQTVAITTPAAARVTVGIGIGGPGPGYYGDYTIRSGRCANPRFAFNHPGRCGYPRYSQPVYIDGAWITEPVYYRTYQGSRLFWWHGGWREGHGDWDGRHFDRDRDRHDMDRGRGDRARDPDGPDRSH
jgi:hypothetical protein